MKEPAPSVLWRVLGNPTATLAFMMIGIVVGALAIYRSSTISQTDPEGPLRREIVTLRDQVSSLEAENQRLSALVSSLREKLAKQQAAQPTPECEEAFVIVRSNVAKDAVSINGKPFGSTGPTKHKICAGEIRVIVTKDGFNPHEEVFRVRAGETRMVRGKLSPQAR